MIMEPKHKNFAGPSKIKETAKKYFISGVIFLKIILNWWHSPFNDINSVSVPDPGQFGPVFFHHIGIRMPI